jgi:hypothetical protein
MPVLASAATRFFSGSAVEPAPIETPLTNRGALLRNLLEIPLLHSIDETIALGQWPKAQWARSRLVHCG